MYLTPIAKERENDVTENVQGNLIWKMGNVLALWWGLFSVKKKCKWRYNVNNYKDIKKG